MTEPPQAILDLVEHSSSNVDPPTEAPATTRPRRVASPPDGT